MTDSVRLYRNFLAKARQNETGLPNNVWAMLMTLDHLFDLTLQSYADNRADIKRLGEKLHGIDTARDPE